jgi:predicted nuclease with TOPRIM domain
VRYDGQLKKFKALMQEKETRIQSLEAKLDQVVTEKNSIDEMMTLRSDEINSLKQHM